MGGLIVQVLGEMCNNGGPWQKFSQTFFLAEQPQGYYVLNDIFRFLKEDVENEYDGDNEEITNKFTFQDEKQKQEQKEKKAPVKEVVKEKAAPKPAAVQAQPVVAQKSAEPVIDKSVKKEAPVAAKPVAAVEQKPTPAKKEPQAPLAWSKIVTSSEPPKQAPQKVVTKVVKPVKKEEDGDGFKEISRNNNTQQTKPQGNYFNR